MSKEIYRDATRFVNERVADLLGRMTFEEKVAQLRGGWPSTDAWVKKDGRVDIADEWKPLLTGAAIGMLGSTLRADPYLGIKVENGLSRREGAEWINKVQRHVLENTRLGIPVLVTDDGHRGQQAIGATMFPQLCGMGATWNPGLQEKVCKAIALEMRTQGVTVNFAPNLDVIRDPRYGRSDQNFGEDPWHVSVMGCASVRGLQGVDLSAGNSVVALLRAYPGLGDADGGHDFTGFSRGLRDLQEVVLRPWRDAVREGAEGVMIEMSEMDGEPVPSSSFYLTELLRNQWGFQGVALDDNGGIEKLYYGWHVAPEKVHAAAMALRAGNDMAMSDASPKRRNGGVYTAEIMGDAIQCGLLSIEDVDRSVARVLRLKFLLGLFENPFVDPDKAVESAGCQEHRQLSLQAARESMVLLKNEGGILPLRKGITSVAVIGPNADNTWSQLGDYARSHSREEVVTVLDGIRAAAQKRGIDIRFAQGCGVRDPSREGFGEATDVAGRSDCIVAVVGGSSRIDHPEDRKGNRARSSESETGEGQARATLDLPGVQEDLLRSLKATGKPLIVVLIHGRSMSIQWVCENADAIVDAWYPGQDGGTAVAEVLFGEYNPGGKLPVTIPRHVGQLPVYYYQRHPNASYVDMDANPLYPFGFGLSYTTFQYANLQVTPAVVPLGETAEVRVEATNTGNVAGDEVVQLYIRDEVASVIRPLKQLKGFRRIHLEPGETRTVVFQIGWNELCFFGMDMKECVEPGDFTFMVGGNSRELISVRLTLTGEDRRMQARRMQD